MPEQYPKKGQCYSLAPSPAWQGIAPTRRARSLICVFLRSKKTTTRLQLLLPTVSAGNDLEAISEVTVALSTPLAASMQARHNN